MNEIDALAERWTAAWPTALAAWSKYTRLRAPLLCRTSEEAKREGLSGSFAMIRLTDQSIVVDLPQVVASGVQDYAVEVLAHEIGHHVFAPSTLTDHMRMLARMRAALPTLEAHAPMVANLYTDLLINDRLQRSAELRLADVYLRLGQDKKPAGLVWALYTRIYELLWRLEKGSLHGGTLSNMGEADAWLGARLIRSFARDWLRGSGRFAVLILPYLLKDKESQSRLEKWQDTREAGQGGDPGGLVDHEADEADGIVHPSTDHDLEEDGADRKTKPLDETPHPKRGSGQAREPFEYGEILRASGIAVTDHEAAVRYYRERARPMLVRFPTRPVPEQLDPLPEGLEPWDFGESLDGIDWMQSVLLSPRVVPGVTTVQRVWGTSPGREPKEEPIDLDLYVDSSGSMPNPQQRTSFLTLAGAIIALSALRVGARVQVTLWSGAKQFLITDGFTRNEQQILEVLTGFFGGGTAFPIHVLRDTHAARPPSARAAHILVISDDGVTTMFDRDEEGNSGWDVAATALTRARGGGTLVLNLPAQWEQNTKSPGPYQDIKKAQRNGWAVHAVTSWEQLEAFAREFSRRKYGTPTRAPAVTAGETGP